MTRTSTIILLFATVLAAALLAGGAGCSSGYERHEVSVDSAEGKAVTKMLADLHSGGVGQVGQFIETHGAAGLTPDQSAGLKNLLTQFAAAPKTQLVSFDRFGPSVFRAGINIGDASASPTVFVLLVASDGQLRWAGVN